MLKIKLARFGKRKQPHYRIVVNEARDKRDGKYTALLGHYAPTQQPKMLEINVEEFEAWIKKGAQPTDTVASLFKRYKSGNPFPPKKPKLSRKAKAKLEAAAEAEKAEKEAKETAKNAPAEKVPAVETPVEEKPAEETKPAEEVKPVEEKAPEAEKSVEEAKPTEEVKKEEVVKVEEAPKASEAPATPEEAKK